MSRIRRSLQRIQRTLHQQVAWPRFEAKSPHFKKLFCPPSRIQRVATGFQFTEGPIWMAAEDCLLFSDIPGNTIYRLQSEGKVSIFRQPSGNANGLTCDRQGRLIACEHGNRRVTRTELDGSITVLANTFEDKPLNSPNDAIVAKDGSIYFTDPPYGIKPYQQQQPVQGVYRIAPTGALTRVVDDFDRPNGLAFNRDGTQLYIDDSSKRRHVRVFDVQPSGELTNGRLFYDMASDRGGDPDGMTVDSQENLYCTGPGGIWVFSEAGQHLGTIVLREQPANCTWGDADYCSLYITARTSVYRIRCRQPGLSIKTSNQD